LRQKLASRSSDLKAQLIGVDPHEKWSGKHLLKRVGYAEDAVKFPLILDAAQTLSATYGVAHQMRIHTEESNRPATFIIDKEGILRQEWRAKTYSDRPAVGQIVEALKKL
jgi:peroxiredoxin